MRPAVGSGLGTGLGGACSGVDPLAKMYVECTESDASVTEPEPRVKRRSKEGTQERRKAANWRAAADTVADTYFRRPINLRILLVNSEGVGKQPERLVFLDKPRYVNTNRVL